MFNGVDLYFSGATKGELLKGLVLIKNRSDAALLYTLVAVYLDDRFDSIRKETLLLILEYTSLYKYDYLSILELIRTPKESQAICTLLAEFKNEDLLNFSESLFRSSITMRLQLIEDLGALVFTYEDILNLYQSNEKEVQAGALSSAGFISDERIYDWLVERLDEEDEGLSAGAVFSLSKHGNSGFSYIAKNLVNISNRLQLISIDLLTFNKVEEAYGYYSQLLIEPNELVAERVLKSYGELGVNGVEYILDGLIIGHPDVKLQLLELLETIPGVDYLDKVLLLLEYPYLQSHIIDLYFRKNAVGLLSDVLIRGDYGLESQIVNYAIKNRSDILFRNSQISDFTLHYFLDNCAVDDLYLYFRDIGFEYNYIEDYLHVVRIDNDLKIIETFVGLNGDIPYVTTFFEIENSGAVAESESIQFFENMENWLETKDDVFLNEKPKDGKTKAKEEDFVNSLTDEEQEEIVKYKNAIKNVVINYRKLTFRFKDFGRIMIKRSGYGYLIR